MSETAHAVQLANRVLDNTALDPDGDLSVLARQFLRSDEARTKLQSAMLECRHRLMALSAGTEGTLRGSIATASNILSRALGKTESSHGDGRYVVEPDSVEF